MGEVFTIEAKNRARLCHAVLTRYTFKSMSTIIELEKDILALPAAERERLATASLGKPGS